MTLASSLVSSTPPLIKMRTRKNILFFLLRWKKQTKADKKRMLCKSTRTCAWGQLKYDVFLVLWTPKQTKKMPQFCPKNDVISKKKKVFTEILTVFPVDIRWPPKKKKKKKKRSSPKFQRFLLSRLSDLQKKKVFTEILTVFSVEIRWSPKELKNKKIFRPHMLISQCHFDGPLSSSLALCWVRWSQRSSWSPWALGSLNPLPPSRWPWVYVQGNVHSG